MIRVKVNGVSCEICTSWDDVDFNKVLKCKEQVDEDGEVIESVFKSELKALSTIPHDIIDKANAEQLFPAYTLISFIDDMSPFEHVNTPVVKTPRIQWSSYDQLEESKIVMRTGKIYQKAIKVARIYYPEERNCRRLVGLGVSIIYQVHEFLNNYKEMFDGEVDTLQEMAGIHTLTPFGPWATVYILGGRDIGKIKEIFNLPAIEVYTAMLYNFREAKFRDEYRRLQTPKPIK